MPPVLRRGWIGIIGIGVWSGMTPAAHGEDVIMAGRAAGRGADRGWIELAGGVFGASRKGAKTGPREQSTEAWRSEGEDTLARTVNFPTRGVWYVWIKVTTGGPWPAQLTWSLDGVQPLKSPRADILVQPYARSSWVSFTRFPGFRIEVNVDAPGDHVLAFKRVAGRVTIEKVLLTLFHSAALKGDGLDMADDPGHGRIAFPHAATQVDGYRADWKAPAIAAAGTTYYLDAEKGDDTALGTAPEKPWKTLGRLNAHDLKPGDAVLLRRGGRWEEPLAPRGSGTAQRWIALGAYGEGDRPVVNGRTKAGLTLRNQEYWSVQDLAFTSDPEYRQDGIDAGVTEGAPRARGLRILNCVAFDTGGHGIEVGGPAGFDGVVIENCLAFCNAGDGITVGGSHATSGRNTVIRRCTAYTNAGMAGIWISGSENGLIEDCLAYNNACVNIWCWNAVNITMRRCEAFRGRPQRDAAGFDIDWGSEACTLEHCYSHHNEGDAFLLMGSGNVDYLDHTKKSCFNVMRFCVAEGHSTIDMGETFNDGKVYNNLAVATGGVAAFKIFGWPNDANNDGGGWPERTEVVNNIFIGMGGASAMCVDDHGTEQGNVFDWNLLWREGRKAPVIQWGGRENGPEFWTGDGRKGTFPPARYASLAAFRKATGKAAHSLEADPGVREPGAGAYGRLPLETAQLTPGSPARGAGTRVVLDEAWLKGRRAFLTDTGAAAYGIPMEPEPDPADYWGTPADPAAPPSIGPQRR